MTRENPFQKTKRRGKRETARFKGKKRAVLTAPGRQVEAGTQSSPFAWREKRGGRLFCNPGLDDAAADFLAVLVGDAPLDGHLGEDLIDLLHHTGDGQGVPDKDRLCKFALHRMQQAVFSRQQNAGEGGEKAGHQHSIADPSWVAALRRVVWIHMDGADIARHRTELRHLLLGHRDGKALGQAGYHLGQCIALDLQS